MKLFKVLILLLAIGSLTSCASSYSAIQPETVNYVSKHEDKGVQLEYKYNLLKKKYKKKESKKKIKIVSIKVTNNSDKDIVFGRDTVLTFENGQQVLIYDTDQAFSMLKQSPASHLLYLLLTPVQFTSSDGNSSSSFPIGLIIGPGIAGANLIVASSANSKFKKDLTDYNLDGVTIKPGETKGGIIGIQSDHFEGLKIKVN